MTETEARKGLNSLENPANSDRVTAETEWKQRTLLLGKVRQNQKEEPLSAIDIKHFTSKPKSCSDTIGREVSKQRKGILRPIAAF